MSGRVLLIDDEDLFREDLATLLREDGFDCRTAADGEEGLRLAAEEDPDVVLCDLMMPGMSGIEVVERLAGACHACSVIVLTAFGSMETAVDAFRKGAVDYVLKPIVLEDLIGKIHRLMAERRLKREVRYLRRLTSEGRAGATIIGDSRAIRDLKKMVQKVADVASTVLLRGESGTGKEVVAKAIHETRFGPEQPFIAVNCSAIPRELFESELFGHMRGSFTGATRERVGYFELARGGTLFLDEIGELPRELQPKLLRAVDTREIQPVGGSRPVVVDLRIIAATNRDLQEEVRQRRFREDLYYRIRVVEITLPPLRDRREDIPLLIDHFLRRLNERLGRRVVGVDPEALRALMSAPWQGNVRELLNVLERGVILADDEVLGLADLPSELTGGITVEESSDDLRAAVRAFERAHIGRVLGSTGGNKEEAARRMSIDPSTLYRRLKDLEIT